MPVRPYKWRAGSSRPSERKICRGGLLLCGARRPRRAIPRIPPAPTEGGLGQKVAPERHFAIPGPFRKIFHILVESWEKGFTFLQRQ